MIYTSRNSNERGAVSIFIVVFTALLVTIVTASFVQIMMRNQQQASNNDLSQSAYDSAMAGVEDAKRALVKLKQCSRTPGLPGCAAVNTLVSNGLTDCESLGNGAGQANIVNFVDGEVMVGGAAQNQAYTCVKVDVQTPSYDGEFLDPSETVVIPLVPVGDPNSLTSVRISWYMADDLPDGQTSPALPSAVDLPRNDGSTWGATVPPIMRAQLIQFNGNTPNISLGAFDGGNARTRFLYPFPSGGTANFGDDNRRAAGTNGLTPGGCSTSFYYKGFACSVVVTLPGMGAGERREAYLQLAAHYIRAGGSLNYMVELQGTGGASVDFDNVQPKVDATGRASDLFRRVRAAVTVSPAGSPDPFPEATITTTNLCKDFFITNAPGQYNGDASGGGTCEP